MIDRNKVLNGLKCCCQMNGHVCRTECPYSDECIENECVGIAHLCANALELLKEQPRTKTAHWIKMKGMMPSEYFGHFECDSCGWHGKLAVREIDFDFCPRCGAKMSIGFPGFDGDDCKSTPLDEILADYLKKMDNENEKEK